MLSGRAVVAIWNDIAPEGRDDFYHWHIHEHMPERVGIPGFLRGRRYRAVDASTRPEFFTLYEVESFETLLGQDYANRLNAPTAWTKSATAHFQNTSRGMARVLASAGEGPGGVIATIRIRAASVDESPMRASLSQLVQGLAAGHQITGAHLCRADGDASSARTAESRDRKDVQAPPDWFILIESCTARALEPAIDALSAIAGVEELTVGFYAKRIYPAQDALGRRLMGRPQSPMDDFNPIDLSDAYAAARRSGERLFAGGLRAPRTFADAVASQAAFARTIAPDVAAWKVAVLSDGMPVGAPMWPILSAPADASRLALQAIEVEICVRLNRDLPPRAGESYSRAEVCDAVGAVHLGVEIIGSRLAEGSDAPFLMFLADLLGNNGYVVGPRLPDMFLDLVRERLTISRDGCDLFDAVAAHPSMAPIAPLVAYCNRQTNQLGGLKKDQIVSTGSLCGVVPIERSAAIEVTLADRWTMRIAV